MDNHPTEFGAMMQPYSEWSIRYLPDMARRDSRKTLASAVEALMRKHYGGVNLSRLAREVVKSPANATRLVKGETSIGVEMIDALAQKFGAEAWQLLVPGYDPDNPPVLTRASSFQARYSAMGLDLIEEFDQIQDIDVKKKLHSDFQVRILAAIRGHPTTPDESELGAGPTASPPMGQSKRGARRQVGP